MINSYLQDVVSPSVRQDRVVSFGGKIVPETSPVIERSTTHDAKREELREGREVGVRSAGTESVVNGDSTPTTPHRAASPPGLAKKSKPDE